MACYKPVFQGQSPALCQLCEIDTKIQWKCIDCDLLLCTRCKDKIHSKVKTAEEHKIINIKEIGKKSEPNTAQAVVKHPDNLQLSIVQEYTTNSSIMSIDCIQVSMEDSLWIGGNDSEYLHKVKLGRENMKIISSFNVDVYDIAITPSNDLILADLTPELKQISFNSNKVTISKYCVDPYDARFVHVTRDNKVVVGAYKGLTDGALYIMDINGVHQQIYTHDKNNEPLFEFPLRIASTSTGTFCVIDGTRLVILEKGEVISIYKGTPKINNAKKRFEPNDVVTTSNDNIIVTDFVNDTLHILNNTGSFISHYNTREIGIKSPCSLAFTMEGPSSILYIGCSSGKLYKLTLYGC